jgi:recombination protein RecA
MAVVAHDHELLSLEPSASLPEMGNAAIDLLAHPALYRLGDRVAPQSEEPEPGWSLAGLAGRLCELSADQGGAVLSAAMSVVLDTQLAGDPVAWVSATSAVFFPPDAAACGVDLAALVVVRAGDARSAGRSADVLLRSGAYGLVVLDLGTSAALPTPLQGRLVQLAQKHDAAVLCLTNKPPDEASLGSLVSLRGQVTRRRVDGGFVCGIRALKDKRRGPNWTWQEVRRGPDGLH